MSEDAAKPLVFISHAAKEDKDIATTLQNWIYLAYHHKVAVFVSSNDGISATDIPSEKLRQQLDLATVLIALHTPASADKPWLTFESAWALGGKKAVFHILCKGADAKDVASPLTIMDQLKDSRDPDQFFEVIECLDEKLGMHHKKETERLRHILSGEDESLPPQLSDEEKACQAITELQKEQKRKEELEILRRKCALAGIGAAPMSVNNGAAGDSVDAAMRESVQTAMDVLERIKVPSVPTIKIH